MKMYTTYLPYGIFGLLLLIGSSHTKSQTAGDTGCRIHSVADLHEFFQYSEDRIPLVCGHRGGAGAGLPENATATFEHTLSQETVFFEVDPRLTKDSVIVVLHDATLDRTTTGQGKLSDYTYEEVQALFLKDADGRATSYKVPLLEDVIQWARGKTVLMLDKKDVPLPMLYDVITKNRAESYVIVSAYSVEEAKFYHDRNKDIMIEAFITSHKRFEQYDESGISWKNIIAYVSQPKSKDLYDKIHERGAMVMVYTARVFDKLPDKAQRGDAYREIIANGADILLSDRPVEAAQAIKGLWPKESNKVRFFKKVN